MGVITHNGEVLQGLPGVASQVNYDNSDSGLSATQVQDAIDEVNEKIDTLKDGSTIDSFSDVENALAGKVASNSIPTLQSLELIPNSGSGHGGYIDFHYNGSSADNTSRIIEAESGNITINGVSITGLANGLNGKVDKSNAEINGLLRNTIFPSTNQQIVNANYDSTNNIGFMWIGNPTNIDNIYFEAKNVNASITDIVGRVNRFRDSFSNDSAIVPLSGSTHLNDITTTCFVNGQGTANGFPTDDWYFVITFIHNNPVYRTQVAFSMTGANNINRTYTRMCQSSAWSSWQQFADKSDISTLQANFQAGVNSVYNAVVAKGVTPASKSLSDVVAGIGNIPNVSITSQTQTFYPSVGIIGKELYFSFTHGVIGIKFNIVYQDHPTTNAFDVTIADVSINGNTVGITYKSEETRRIVTVTAYGY